MPTLEGGSNVGGSDVATQLRGARQCDVCGCKRGDVAGATIRRRAARRVAAMGAAMCVAAREAATWTCEVCSCEGGDVAGTTTRAG